MNSYDQGALVQLSGTFKNAAGTPTDPTSVTCTVRDPAFNVTTPAVTRQSAGVWTANVDLTNAAPGVWTYRFQGVGTVQAAEEQTFYVEATGV